MYLSGYANCGMGFTTPIIVTISDIDSIIIKNGIFDELYSSKNTSYTIGDSIPTSWDLDTILHCHFNGSLIAGNSSFIASLISAILIRRRIIGTSEWKTINQIPINSVDDLNFTFYDNFVQSGVTYEYIAVPIINGQEGNYSGGETITAEFEGLFVIEPNITYSTLYNLNINVNKNKPVAVISTLNSRYPFVISNSNNNYYTGSVSGVFVRCDSSDYDYNHFINGREYRENFNDFLLDGQPKIIKYQDGRVWMAQIQGNPSQSHGEHEYMPTTSFEFVEIGAMNDEDLAREGFTNVDSDWWVE